MVKTARQPDINYTGAADPDALGVRLVVYFHETERAPKCRPRVRRGQIHDEVLNTVQVDSRDAWDVIKKAVAVNLIEHVENATDPNDGWGAWDLLDHVRDTLDEFPDVDWAKFGHEKAY